MAFSDDQVMLTLAALAYRGVQDVFTGTLHEEFVQEALLEGLDRFEPVRGQWKLVWGPAATRRVPLKNFRTLNVFDWNAMYVVRHLEFPNKYVVAIRGTNPVAAPDWLFGDLWVNTTVRWPYGDGKEVISGSTALGLAALQGMRSAGPESQNETVHFIAKETQDLFHAIVRQGQRALKGLTGHTPADKLSLVEKQLNRIIQHWLASAADRDAVRAQIQRLTSEELVEQHELRPRLMPESERNGRLDLLTFLRTQADASQEPLEVTVTGHSKGGALAPTVALWLKEATLESGEECWDKRQKARVRFYAFAGPTPGNGAFADRLDTKLNDSSHYLVNTNDVVPQAFQVDQLNRIPDLYRDRTSGLKTLVENLIAGIEKLNYRHSVKEVRKFAGELDPSRSLAAELIHQHLDAYLAELRLLSDEFNALTCFV